MSDVKRQPTAVDAGAILARVRAQRPRVHCLMNTVVQKFTADGITVVGGIPSMTSSRDEIADFVAKADALTINLGTLDAERRAVIRIAVDIANASGKPWIMDPVHCDYSPAGWSSLANSFRSVPLSCAAIGQR